MAAAGVVTQSGQAKSVDLHGSRLDYLLTGKDARGGSLFEFRAAPGFDTGVHYHTKIEEFFYVLDGELELRCGDQIIRATPGTFVFIPVGAHHSFANRGDKPARTLFGCMPPGHENYFDGLAALLATGGPPDAEAIGELRRKYDTIQVSRLLAK